MTVDEALERVWSHDDDRQTALVLACEVIELRERLAQIEATGREVAEVVRSIRQELASV